MKRAYITAVAATALLATGVALSPPAHAASGTAPFGCDAHRNATCYFRLYLGPRSTRTIQLTSGMKVNVPGVDIGNDRYCVSVNQRPLPKCAQTVINATYNH